MTYSSMRYNSLLLYQLPSSICRRTHRSTSLVINGVELPMVVLGAGRLHVERLSTPTSVLDVRATKTHIRNDPGSAPVRTTFLCRRSTCDSLFEDEPRAHPILHPIHLTPHDAKQRPGIDEDLDSVLFHDLVEPIDRIEGKVREVVGESRAASVADGDSEQLG